MALLDAISCSLHGGRMSSAIIAGRVSGMAMVPCSACLGFPESAAVVGARTKLMGVDCNTSRAFLRRRKDVDLKWRGQALVIVARSGGGSSPPYRPPRVSTGPRRSQTQQEAPASDAPLMNSDIRVPYVRLLDEEQNMLGVVSSAEALQKAREAELDLVMISPDADPPVVRIMDYSKYRYEMQKRKREAQKKAAASRQVLKELKMRYNIDTHDYAVRRRAAERFLRDGDKVKVICQFKGRELEFKDLAVKLFDRFNEEIGELGVLETKISMEGKAMYMVIAPNKAVVQRAQATAQSQASKAKSQGGEKKATRASISLNEIDETTQIEDEAAKLDDGTIQIVDETDDGTIQIVDEPAESPAPV